MRRHKINLHPQVNWCIGGLPSFLRLPHSSWSLPSVLAVSLQDILGQSTVAVQPGEPATRQGVFARACLLLRKFERMVYWVGVPCGKLASAVLDSLQAYCPGVRPVEVLQARFVSFCLISQGGPLDAAACSGLPDDVIAQLSPVTRYRLVLTKLVNAGRMFTRFGSYG